jgi:hypothetical protein
MPFSPSDLANLAGWWKADALSLSDGDAIGTWIDSSGNGKDLTQATTAKKPTFKTSILNSLAVARFDGGDQVTVGSFDLSATDKLTIFIVSSATSDAVGQILVEHGTDNNSDLPSFVLAVDGATSGKLQGATFFAAASTTASVGTSFHIFAVQFDRVGTTTPTQVFIRLGSETVSQNTDASNDVTGNFASKTLHVGARGGSLIAPLTGDIAELIVYSDFKSVADLNQVGAYLASKYALTWIANPSPSHVAGSGSVQSPSIVTDQTVTPSTVAGVGAVQPPGISTLSPAVILGVGTVQTPALVDSGRPACVLAIGTVQQPSPPNDDFANAIDIGGDLIGTVSGTNRNATIETGEPDNSDSGDHQRTVWWKWIAPAGATTAHFDTNGSLDDRFGGTNPLDTTLAVFRGSTVGALIPIIADDDTDDSVNSRVGFTPVAGVTYHLQVGGYGSDDVGLIILNWEIAVSTGWPPVLGLFGSLPI